MSEEFPPAGEPTPPTGDATPPPPPPPPPPAAPTPPPPPAPGYSAPAVSPADGPWSVGNAFSYGWAKFQQYLSPILIAMLALFVAGAVIIFIWFLVIGAITSALTKPLETVIDPNTGAISFTGGGGPGLIISLFLAVLGGLVYFTVFGFIQGAVARAALTITEGRPIESSTILTTDKLGPIIITAVLVSVATSIGTLACYVGSIVVAFFLSFSFYFLLDQNLTPVDSLKASFNFVKDHIGDVIILFLVSYVAYFVGAAICGIGLLVAVPVVAIATAYTYKKLTNQAVAA